MKKLMLSIVLLMSGVGLLGADKRGEVDPLKISSALRTILNYENIIKPGIIQWGFDAARVDRIFRRLETAKLFADERKAAAAAGLIDDAINIVGGEHQAKGIRLTINGKDYQLGFMLMRAKNGEGPFYY